MDAVWKSVEVFVPSKLTPVEVSNYVRAEIRIIASDAGDFVRAIRIGLGAQHGNEWRKWSASYLIGPPGLFPAGEPAV